MIQNKKYSDTENYDFFELIKNIKSEQINVVVEIFYNKSSYLFNLDLESKEIVDKINNEDFKTKFILNNGTVKAYLEYAQISDISLNNIEVKSIKPYKHTVEKNKKIGNKSSKKPNFKHLL